MSILPTRQINVAANLSLSSAVATPSIVGWNFEVKINKAKTLLADVILAVGDRDIEYIEKRISINNGKITVSDKKFKDAERQIALILLNKNTQLNSMRVKKSKKGENMSTSR